MPVKYHYFSTYPQAHWKFCHKCAQVSKSFRDRNWDLAFAHVHRQPLNFDSVLEVAQSKVLLRRAKQLIIGLGEVNTIKQISQLSVLDASGCTTRLPIWTYTFDDFRKLCVSFVLAAPRLHHHNTLLSTGDKFRWGTKMFRHEEPKFTTNDTAEPKFQSRCHCTSTYPLHGVWLPLAPPPTCHLNAKFY